MRDRKRIAFNIEPECCCCQQLKTVTLQDLHRETEHTTSKTNATNLMCNRYSSIAYSSPKQLNDGFLRRNFIFIKFLGSTKSLRLQRRRQLRISFGTCSIVQQGIRNSPYICEGICHSIQRFLGNQFCYFMPEMPAVNQRLLRLSMHHAL